MENENETVADAIELTKAIFFKDIGVVNERCQWCRDKLSERLDRIEAAHKREVDSLTFELMTAKSEQKTAANVIIEQTNKVEKLEREVAGLRECLKEACRYRCGKCNVGNLETESHFCGNYCDTIKRWRNALEGVEDGK